jgi:hypothetical protein
VGKQNQGEPVGFRVDPVRKALHRSYSGMDQPTAQSLGGSLRTKSGQRDETSSRISSLIHAIRPVALDERADAGKVL